jgi:hypothetical protein
VVFGGDRRGSLGGIWRCRSGALNLADEGNLATSGELDRGVVEYILLGHAKEFVPRSEIPLALVRDAVKEFLATGGRLPTCIDWQEEDL